MADYDNETPEEWRPVPVEGFEHRYMVSNHGRIARIQSPSAKVNGHRGVSLNRNNTKTEIYLHRLVLMAFVGPPPSPKHEGAHWDGNPDNNRVENLRWATSKENKDDIARHGRRIQGERHYAAKMTPDTVRELRALYATGEYTCSQLAERYGLHRVSVQDIVNRTNWKHV